MNTFQKGCLVMAILTSIAGLVAGDWKKTHWFTMLVGVVVVFTLGFLIPESAPIPGIIRSADELSSRNARIVQQLLRGEEIPLAHYRGLDVFDGAHKLKLADDVIPLLGEDWRYTIRFNTNAVPVAGVPR